LPFPYHSVNPIYYVFFSSSTIIASAILFQGFNTTDASNTISLLCGFLVIFMGVYLLNLSREPDSAKPKHSVLESGMMSESFLWIVNVKLSPDFRPMVDPRMSMSGRASNDAGAPLWAGSNGSINYAPDGTPLSATHGRKSALYHQQNNTLYSSFGEEHIGLTDLAEADDEEEEDRLVGDQRRDSSYRLQTDMDSPRR
jgi:hypothetical protein